MGSVCQKEVTSYCEKSLIHAFWKMLFNFMLWSFGYLFLSHPTPLPLHEFEAMYCIIFALASTIRVWLKQLRESYETLCCQFPIFCPLLPHPPAFTCICGNALHYVCDGVCGSREDSMCNKGLNGAFGEKILIFILFSFRYLVLCQPTPLRSHAFVSMHSIMIAMGSVDQEKLACAIKD